MKRPTVYPRQKKKIENSNNEERSGRVKYQLERTKKGFNTCGWGGY